jgi:chromosome segregation ATPase
MTGRESEELVLLKTRVSELISRFEQTTAELRNARSENEKLIYELRERDEKYAELENEYNRLKLSGAILGDGENTLEAKKRINNLVREIDNCIALLNNI